MSLPTAPGERVMLVKGLIPAAVAARGARAERRAAAAR